MKLKWWHILTLAAPGAYVAWYLNRSGGFAGQLTLVIFGLALLALIPLATLVGQATEDLAFFLGDLAGGLLNATLSNVPELAIGVFLLIHASAHINTPATAATDLDVIRGLLIGSVIENILLTLGLSVFLGALRNGRMTFNASNAAGYASMLALAVVGLALPTISTAFARKEDATVNTTEIVSLLVGGVLLVTYMLYIGSDIFGWGEPSSRGARGGADAAADRNGEASTGETLSELAYEEGVAAAAGVALVRPGTATETEVEKLITAEEHDAEQSAERERSTHQQRRREQPVRFARAIVVLFAVTAVTVAIAGLLVSVTDNVIVDTPLTPLSTGLILFPIVCNMGEGASALLSGWRNKMELAMSVAAGSSVQIPLFVTPLLVFIGFVLARGNSALDLTLIFKPLELIVVGLVTFVYALVNLDGETTWLEGLQLLAFYAMIAVTAFALPGA